MLDRKRVLLRSILAITWAALIFWGSTDLLSDQRTSRFLTPFLRWLVPGIRDESIAMARAVIRKGGHVTEFAVMAALVAWSARGTRLDDGGRRLFACAWLVATLYAVTDEWHQSFQPSRHGQALDVAIDSAGAVLGAWTFVTVARWMARRRGTAHEA